ncbi:MAG: serine/threonine protein kinase [Candidatus Obscuribacterales bacterium]|nr:serine/threonine protein kinase [Candidatus Obscuribacterales bacterium]
MQNRLNPGQLINGAYEILELIGEGGMGYVYKALQIDLKRIVALKLLKEEFLEDDEHLARFQREGRALSALVHPNVINCYAFGFFQERQPFLVFEFIDGISLRSLLNERQRLGVNSSLAIGAQICAALSAAHAASVIHRDLKPENIMLLDSEPYRVKVLDFGLSRLLHQEEKLTQTGFLVGSVAYMSPEQCSGGKLDGRSDLYSAGCVIFECLSGRKVFEAESPLALVYKHVNETAPSLLSVMPDLPRELGLVLAKALAKDPANRYASAAEFQRDLLDLKCCIEENREFDSPHLKLALPRLSTRKAKAVLNKIMAPLILILLFLLLAFLISDPGIAVFQRKYLELSERRKTNYLEALEKNGDSSEQNGRYRAALIFYDAAFEDCPESDIESRLRLRSKQGISFYKQGEISTALKYFFESLPLFADLGLEKISEGDWQRLFCLAELNSKAWPVDVFSRIWTLGDAMLLSSNPKLGARYNYLFFLSDTPAGDQVMMRAKTFLEALVFSEKARDSALSKRILDWAAAHSQRLGVFRKAVLGISPDLRSAKNSVMQAVVDYCGKNKNSPESASFLLTALAVPDSLFFVCPFDPKALEACLKPSSDPEMRAAALLAYARAAVDAGRATESERYIYDAVLLLPELEDRIFETWHPRQYFKEWLLRLLLHTLEYEQDKQRVFRPLNLKSLKLMDNWAMVTPRLVTYGVASRIHWQIFIQWLLAGNFVEAEKLMRAELEVQKPLPAQHNVCIDYFLLARILEIEKKVPEMRALLLEADEYLDKNKIASKDAYWVWDAWRYYYRASGDLEKAHLFDSKIDKAGREPGSDIWSHYNWCNTIDWHIKGKK